jgi:GWxTD domain-containing protein
MMASLRAAVEAYPGHVDANTDLLITLAQEERWEDLLSGARRFARTSEGHPNALLLAAIALHRLDRSTEAAEHFDVALARMTETDAERLSQVGVLLDGAEAAEYGRLAPAERRAWETSYWALRDRSPSTEVNERWVEHMARTSYTHLRFGSAFGDASEVWVRFGRPNHVNVVDDGTGRLTEFWDYGSGPDITFVRWVSAKRTDLTPEGRAYVDDLGKIFPPQ